MANSLKAAVAAIKQGDMKTGTRLLSEVMQHDLDQKEAVAAWLWLSLTEDEPEWQRMCLEAALGLDPDNASAKRGLDRLRSDETNS